MSDLVRLGFARLQVPSARILFFFGSSSSFSASAEISGIATSSVGRAKAAPSGRHLRSRKAVQPAFVFPIASPLTAAGLGLTLHHSDLGPGRAGWRLTRFHRGSSPSKVFRSDFCFPHWISVAVFVSRSSTSQEFISHWFSWSGAAFSFIRFCCSCRWPRTPLPHLKFGFSCRFLAHSSVCLQGVFIAALNCLMTSLSFSLLRCTVLR
jgi:hypothetical protein